MMEGEEERRGEERVGRWKAEVEVEEAEEVAEVVVER